MGLELMNILHDIQYSVIIVFSFFFFKQQKAFLLRRLKAYKILGGGVKMAEK